MHFCALRIDDQLSKEKKTFGDVHIVYQSILRLCQGTVVVLGVSVRFKSYTSLDEEGRRFEPRRRLIQEFRFVLWKIDWKKETSKSRSRWETTTMRSDIDWKKETLRLRSRREKTTMRGDARGRSNQPSSIGKNLKNKYCQDINVCRHLPLFAIY